MGLGHWCASEPTDDNDWVSMGVLSDGSYGIEKGLIYSFPVTISEGQVSIVKGLDVNEFSKEKMRITMLELKEEREAIQDPILVARR